MEVSWDIATWFIVEIDLRLRGACYSHDEGSKPNKTSVNSYDKARLNIPEDSHSYSQR
jgi:hypothetical protein